LSPDVLRAAFRIAALIFVVALATLPFQPRGSAEFYVTILALLVGAAFAAAVIAVVRLSTPALPPLSGRRPDQAGRPDEGRRPDDKPPTGAQSDPRRSRDARERTGIDNGGEP
jgi:hypothetical protein